MPNGKFSYRAFVLRTWHESSLEAAETGIWRYSLEDPHSGERYGFATIDALVAFLQSQTVQAQ
jgi:hypothetical protein